MDGDDEYNGPYPYSYGPYEERDRFTKPGQRFRSDRELYEIALDKEKIKREAAEVYDKKLDLSYLQDCLIREREKVLNERTIQEKKAKELEEERKKAEDAQKEARNIVNIMIEEKKILVARITELKIGKDEKKEEKEKKEEQDCVICMDAPVDTILSRCGHLCCCNNCAINPLLISCPVCRGIITDKVKIYKV